MLMGQFRDRTRRQPGRQLPELRVGIHGSIRISGPLSEASSQLGVTCVHASRRRERERGTGPETNGKLSEVLPRGKYSER